MSIMLLYTYISIKIIKDEPTFHDAVLECDIDKWLNMIDICTCTIKKTIIKTVISVANLLLHNKAILLPRACELFFDFYGVAYDSDMGATTSIDLRLDLDDQEVKFSSCWMLNQILIYLSPYMLYKCIIKKYGIFYITKVVIYLQLYHIVCEHQLIGKMSLNLLKLVIMQLKYLRNTP